MTELDSQADEIRKLVELYGTRFAIGELERLSLRLQNNPDVSDSWVELLGDIAACAVYNGLDLCAAERLVIQR